jgi:hypothetical protein
MASDRGLQRSQLALHSLLVLALGAASMSGAVVRAQSIRLACASNNEPVACTALSELYSSTNGPGSWLKRTNWDLAAANVTTNYCTFYGVECDKSQAAVGTTGMGKSTVAKLCVARPHACACLCPPREPAWPFC